jgi:hypothetical protein
MLPVLVCVLDELPGSVLVSAKEHPRKGAPGLDMVFRLVGCGTGCIDNSCKPVEFGAGARGHIPRTGKCIECDIHLSLLPALCLGDTLFLQAEPFEEEVPVALLSGARARWFGSRIDPGPALVLVPVLLVYLDAGLIDRLLLLAFLFFL